MKTIRIKRSFKNVTLTIIMDREDYDRLIVHGIRLARFRAGQYAIRVGKNRSLSRAVLNYSGPLIIDHRNRNYLDNRKCNLRTVNARQSAANTSAHRDSIYSKFKGVSWDKSRRGTKCWQAQIQVGPKKYKKTFYTEKEAARQYDEWASQFQGEFAVLNNV